MTKPKSFGYVFRIDYIHVFSRCILRSKHESRSLRSETAENCGCNAAWNENKLNVCIAKRINEKNTIRTKRYSFYHHFSHIISNYLMAFLSFLVHSLTIIVCEIELNKQRQYVVRFNCSFGLKSIIST